jgi:glycosyltransferase involved in cell wall biosynthesis
VHDKKSGLLIPSCDADAIVKAILTLYSDENLRNSLSLEAKKSIHQYSIESMKNRYLNIYPL